MDKEKLKQLLEDTAKESGLKITGEIVCFLTNEEVRKYLKESREEFILNLREQRNSLIGIV